MRSSDTTADATIRPDGSLELERALFWGGLPLPSALVAASIVDAHDGLLEWAKEQIEPTLQ